MATVRLPDFLARIYRLHADGIKLGLEAERALLARLGHPDRAAPCIHVAGTNGKGSVCALLESVLRAAGCATGLYTSPHLVRFNERIRVGGRPASDEALEALIPALDAAAQAAAAEPGGRPSTFFEYTTALAFAAFQRASVNLAVLETGMGGRLDATNVVTPLVSVITGISLDHTEHLGRDRAAIAAEKAGIIKPGRPVVVGPLPADALAVVRQAARERGAPLIEAAELVSVRRVRQALDGQRVVIESGAARYGTLVCPLLGRHQLDNLAVAVTVLEVLRDRLGLPIPPESVARGLAAVRWPARCQVLAREPVTILDGAHNPEGAACLARALKDLAGGRPVGLVAGLCADKDADGFLAAFAGLVSRAWAVPLRSERGLAPAALADRASRHGLSATAAPSVDAGLEAAESWGRARGGLVGIAGSLFLAGEVLEQRVGPDRLFS